MNDEQFSAFIDTSIADYAADKVSSGQWAEAQSLELSRKELEELLPQGLKTPENYLFSVLDEHGTSVGTLWIGVKEFAGKRSAYIYDVWISPSFRRRGHATRALLAAEEEARKLGFSGIGLHVFGHNVAARTLYEALGYRTTNINMFKTL
jgi:ribosomal protein S18 acetylase RimI-like enzyme